MRIIDQWIDEGNGLFMNFEIMVFTFCGKRIYWGCFGGSVAFPASGSGQRATFWPTFLFL